MDSSENTAHRQYAIGVINRRIATAVAEVDRVFREVTGTSGKTTFLCACGREGGCHSSLTIPIADFELVRESPHRFLVAPGHAQLVDEVVHEADGYEIVEIKPQYRDPSPPTA